MLTIKRALELSIMKWRFLVTNPKLSDDGNNDNVYPEEITGLLSSCGLCQYYKGDGMGGCYNCPLNDGQSLCCFEYEQSQMGIVDLWRTKEDVILYRHRMIDRLQELLKCVKSMPKGYLDGD